MRHPQNYSAQCENVGACADRSCLTLQRFGDGCVHLSDILDLFAEDSQLNVYAGEGEVRPPRAPTTRPDTEERGRWVNPSRLLGSNQPQRTSSGNGSIHVWPIAPHFVRREI
jgi:hypothetical protein